MISVAAGIRETSLRDWLGDQTAIVRCMPNTPALVQSGATALYANARVSEDQRSLAETVMRAVGLALWVEDESQMDAVTALSGSGPAYFFLTMEAMSAAGEELGLSRETAHLLTLQTALGAARMAIESSETPEHLRHRVTSPGGTTERALEVLEHGGVRDIFDTFQRERGNVPNMFRTVAARPLAGAAAMLLFGLGTIPVLIAFALGAARISPAAQRRFNQLTAVLVLLIGVQLALRGAAALGWIGHLRFGSFVIY